MEKLYTYYQNYSEDVRLVKDKSHHVEFLTTTCLLDRVVKPHSKVLDVGAGTGRYSFYLANRGHSVYALEFTPYNLSIIQECLVNSESKGNMEAALGDGRDLSRFEDKSFDVVLCMGPLYHLFDEADRKQCISECLRVLKKGGILAVAYINKYASYMYSFRSDKTFLTDEASKNLIQYGCYHRDGSDHFYFTSPQEIEAIMEAFAVERITNAATDGVGFMMKDIVDNLNDEEYEAWVQHHIATCEDMTLLGYSLHGLHISRKL